MKLSREQLEFCFGKVKEISDQYDLYHLDAGDPQRSIDNLLDTCKAYLGVNIKLLEIDIDKDQSAVWAACIKTADSYDIGYVSGLNFCWRRFCVCKELFHVCLDLEEYRNMNLDDHVREVTVAFPDNESSPSPSVRSELLAELAAMEFLFPYLRREQELAGENKENFLAIAERYKIPQVHVERYLSKPFMEVLKKYSGA